MIIFSMFKMVNTAGKQQMEIGTTAQILVVLFQVVNFVGIVNNQQTGFRECGHGSQQFFEAFCCWHGWFKSNLQRFG